MQELAVCVLHGSCVKENGSLLTFLSHDDHLFVFQHPVSLPLLEQIFHFRERFGSINGGHVFADQFFFAVF